ncbi:MAG: hypothetical protein COV35_04625 [Alphaproteobacteria bacterium CG11_big_fil_rev_8_21_14_0_20_39_49]|nr:MAG: hypothetical protein COV35_04625 [Alphaproteobacteria bacterium CG11_big_fil_rev_8_21_14_0_20_39_49]
MVVLSKEEEQAKTAAKEEINETLNRIFAQMNKALADKSPDEIAKERIDETLNALFEAVNQSTYQGKKTKIPDFKRIINGEF